MKFPKDLTGQKFGRLTAVSLLPKSEWKHCSVWHCKCDCGNECNVRRDQLLTGTTKSCGCLFIESAREKGLKSRGNLIGQRFGRLTVLEYAEYKPGHGVKYICKCDCGNKKIVSSAHLTKGDTKSCGCLRSDIGIERFNSIYFRNKANQIAQSKIVDLTGKKFGAWTALYIDEESRNKKGLKWVCLCACGEKRSVLSGDLINGHSKSCGCVLSSKLKRIFFEKTGEIVSKTDKIIFLDGNKQNSEKSNMVSVSNKIYAMMHRNKLFSSDPELTKSAILACELECSARSVEKYLV